MTWLAAVEDRQRRGERGGRPSLALYLLESSRQYGEAMARHNLLQLLAVPILHDWRVPLSARAYSQHQHLSSHLHE